MSFDNAAFTAKVKHLQDILARAKAAGDFRSVENMAADLVLLVAEAQVFLAETFAAALVDHEKRLIAVEAGLRGAA